MFLAKLFEHVSSLTAEAFGCYSMLTTLPLNCLNTNNVNKVVKVVPQ